MKTIKTAKYTKLSQLDNPSSFLDEVSREADRQVMTQYAGSNNVPVRPGRISRQTLSIGLSDGGLLPSQEWVQLAEEYRNNDLNGAISKVVQACLNLYNDPKYQEKAQEHTGTIKKDVNDYYDQGGTNWSGD